MDDLKRMTDQQLAERMVYYIESTQNLMSEIDKVLLGQGNPVIRNQVYENYKRLKKELREDKHYLKLNINSRKDANAELYNNFVKPSICDAAIFGFCAPSNCKISRKMYEAVSDAHYQLTKYHLLDEWEEFSKMDN